MHAAGEYCDYTYDCLVPIHSDAHGLLLMSGPGIGGLGGAIEGVAAAM